MKGVLVVFASQLVLAALAGSLAIADTSQSSGFTLHSPILINGNAGFIGSNGVIGGNGTPLNPYVIAGWEINASGNTNGIEVGNTQAYFLIRDVDIHSGYSAVYIHDAAHGRVEHSLLSHNAFGFDCFNASNLLVFDNEIMSNSAVGVQLGTCDRVSIINNTIETSQYGNIGLFSATNTLVSSNIISMSEGGIILSSAVNTSLFKNIVSWNYVGINVVQSTNATLVMNQVHHNRGTGIYLTSSRSILAFRNDLVNNGRQAYDDGGIENSWDGGYPRGGNFWSDYVGTDNCSGPAQDVCTGPDGFGDLPYVIDMDSRDNYPSVNPIAYTSPLAPHAPILIVGDGNFTLANGVTRGTGTVTDPYIIEGWDITAASANGIEVRATRSYFVIRNVSVEQGGEKHHGVALEDVAHARVEGVTALSNLHGIDVESSQGCTIIASNASGNVNNIYVQASSDILIANSIARDGGIGIDVRDSANVAIMANMASKNFYGIYLWYDDAVFIRNNEMTDDYDFGIAVGNSGNVTATENDLVKSESDISYIGMVVGASHDVLVFHNNFIASGRIESMASDTGGINNRWDDGYPSGGNYWANYTGMDVCSGPAQNVCAGPDGIGDTPQLFKDNQDRYPLMVPFKGGPGLSASFTWSPAVPIVGETVVFNASSSYASSDGIATYAWNFGDGTGGSGLTITHAFSFAGNYTVVLAVSTTHGQRASTSSLVRIEPRTLSGVPLVDLARRGAWAGDRRLVCCNNTIAVLYARLSNTGTDWTWAAARFNIFDSAGRFAAKLTSATVALDPGATVVVWANWTPQAQGRYTVTAVAIYDSDGNGTLDATGSKTKTFSLVVL